MSTRFPLAVVAWLALSASLAAQPSEAQAVAQAKAGLKAALKAEKVALLAVEEQLGAAIDLLGQAAQAGPLTAELLEGMLPSWLDGLSDFDSVVSDARADASGAARDALVALADGADLDGQFPAAFYLGGPGFADEIEIKTGEVAQKMLKRLRKRADKACQAAAAAGIGLSIVLTGPNGTINGPPVFDEEDVLVSGLGAGQLRLAIGTSVLGQSHDGLLLVGGNISGFDGPVDVRIVSMSNGEQINVVATFEEDEEVILSFGGVIDDEGAGLLEGNCIISLEQTGTEVDEIGASVP